MKNFEVIVNKGNSSNVVAENITPIKEQEGGEFWKVVVDNEVLKYLKNIEIRNSAQAKETINSVKNNTKIDSRVLRTPEAGFQNALLRIAYRRNLTKDQLKSSINESLAKYKKEDSLEMQTEIEIILGGVESCMEAAESIENELKLKNKEEEIIIATNNEFDARYQVDLMAMIEKGESIQTLNLVQVKSREKQTNIDNITDAHQKYLDSLPQLIGMLNIKEAVKSVEEEIIDIDRNEERKDQLTIFGLVLDQYINNVKESENVNAKDLYKLLSDEGLRFNPFTVMGILKNKKVMDGYRKDNYFNGDEKVEELLSKTADQIPYTDRESIAFHKKNHLHTIIDSAEIFSVVMIGGKKVSEKKLLHPYNKE